MSGDPLAEAVARLAGAGLVAYPTESVWGLGADATRADAVEALRRWKGRSEQAPLSILVDGPDALGSLGLEAGDAARRLAERFWPGPLTLVLPGRGGFAPGVARADGAVGVRCSSHPLAAALARRLRREGVGPVTATSLNRSGDPPARTRDEAALLCDGSPGAPLLWADPGAEAGGGGVSSVIDLSGPEPRLLRRGALDEARLRSVLDGSRAA